MRDLVLGACRSNPAIRDKAISLTQGLGITGPADVAQAVEWMARDSFVLVDEPEELLIDPSVMLSQLEVTGRIYGDCDDVSMFTACLLYCIGVPVRFKAIQAGENGSYNHVFTEYSIGGRWIPVDPTIDGIPVYADGDYITQEV